MVVNISWPPLIQCQYRQKKRSMGHCTCRSVAVCFHFVLLLFFFVFLLSHALKAHSSRGENIDRWAGCVARFQKVPPLTFGTSMFGIPCAVLELVAWFYRQNYVERYIMPLTDKVGFIDTSIKREKVGGLIWLKTPKNWRLQLEINNNRTLQPREDLVLF